MTDERILDLGHRGLIILCDEAEYRGGLRGKIQDAAAKWLDHGEPMRAQIALSEVKRLDERFNYG